MYRKVTSPFEPGIGKMWPLNLPASSATEGLDGESFWKIKSFLSNILCCFAHLKLENLIGKKNWLWYLGQDKEHVFTSLFLKGKSRRVEKHSREEGENGTNKKQLRFNTVLVGTHVFYLRVFVLGLETGSEPLSAQLFNITLQPVTGGSCTRSLTLLSLLGPFTLVSPTIPKLIAKLPPSVLPFNDYSPTSHICGLSDK